MESITPDARVFNRPRPPEGRSRRKTGEMMKLFDFLKPSAFAPAARKEEPQIHAESEALKSDLKRCSILNMLPELIVILNAERQIIFANQAVIRFLHQEDDAAILGRRPGEVLDCVHAHNDSGGCGTSEYCRFCGAVNAILHTQQFHGNACEECRIITSADKGFNLRIWTSVFVKGGSEYTLAVLRDIGDEVYRNSLERMFFHDLTNIASGMYGLLALIGDDPDAFRDNRRLLLDLTEELLEEINSQRDILAAERGTIGVAPCLVGTFEVMHFVVEMFAHHQDTVGKRIVLDENSEEIELTTDPRLLKRVLVNMTKNALEASAPGESVRLKASGAGDKVVFEVYNAGVIDSDVQMQIFKRAFSTKGCGRGLGTYSMKLLGEKYLGGRVYFSSSAGQGTSFFLELPRSPGRTALPESKPERI